MSSSDIFFYFIYCIFFWRGRGIYCKQGYIFPRFRCQTGRPPISHIISVSGRIQDGAELFANVNWRKLHNAKITLYTVRIYSFWRFASRSDTDILHRWGTLSSSFSSFCVWLRWLGWWPTPSVGRVWWAVTEWAGFAGHCATGSRCVETNWPERNAR